MTNLFLIASTLLSLAPVAPATRDARPAAATVAAGTEMPTSRVAAPAAQRYCVVSDVTGSRIARRVCQTRADWLKDGFDPLATR
ncbi:hypothetical protein U1872_17825 [Sphingomonas sp. RB3P16]|uniref:hypothetical protein n=1 Tax=Parasphingomonas frigoris TaxID=3096163 RepID=UPI002FC76ECB